MGQSDLAGDDFIVTGYVCLDIVRAVLQFDNTGLARFGTVDR